MKGSQRLKPYTVTCNNTTVLDVANLAIETADWSNLPGRTDVLGVLSKSIEASAHIWNDDGRPDSAAVCIFPTFWLGLASNPATTR